MVLDDTRTLRTGSDVSDFFELEAVVGLMKAGRVWLERGAPLELDDINGVLLVKLPIGCRVEVLDGAEREPEDNLSDRGILSLEHDTDGLGVTLVVLERLLPEFDLDRFSFELPESPRLTLIELLGALLDARCWAMLRELRVADFVCSGARGRLGVLLNLDVEAFDALLTGTFLKDPSLDCLLSEPTERTESFLDTGLEGTPPLEVCKLVEERSLRELGRVLTSCRELRVTSPLVLSDVNPRRRDLVMFLNGDE